MAQEFELEGHQTQPHAGSGRLLLSLMLTGDSERGLQSADTNGARVGGAALPLPPGVLTARAQGRQGPCRRRHQGPGLVLSVGVVVVVVSVVVSVVVGSK